MTARTAREVRHRPHYRRGGTHHEVLQAGRGICFTDGAGCRRSRRRTVVTSNPVDHPAPGGLTRHIEMKIQLPGVFSFRLSAEIESDFSIGNATVAAEEEQ